jgi:hypothetical protein
VGQWEVAIFIVKEQGMGWLWLLAVVGTGAGWLWWLGVREHGVLVVFRGRCGHRGVVSGEGAGVVVVRCEGAGGGCHCVVVVRRSSSLLWVREQRWWVIERRWWVIEQGGWKRAGGSSLSSWVREKGVG